MSCRLCLKRCKGIILISTNEPLRAKIRDCLNIDVDDCDNLPNKLCAECHQKVEDFSNFKNISSIADRILQNALITNSIHIFLDTIPDVESESIKSVDEDNKEEYYEVGLEIGRGTEKCNSLTNNEVNPLYYHEIMDDGFDSDVVILEHTSDLDSIIDEHEEIQIKLEEDENSRLDKNEKPEKNRQYEQVYHHITDRDDLNMFKSDSDSENISKTMEKHRERVQCPTCSKSMFRRSLKAHMVKHTDRFKCPHCPRRMSSKANISVHIKSFHTTIRDHICKLCGKGFAHANLLNIHMKSHSDERIYKCQLCDYAGRTSSALQSHKITHATSRPHLCDMCAKSFRSVTELRLHKRRTHNKERTFVCNQCGAAFFRNYRLKLHMRTHTGDKPYICEVCNKCFARSDALKEHMDIHRNTVYKCEKCNKKFVCKRSVKNHVCEPRE